PPSATAPKDRLSRALKLSCIEPVAEVPAGLFIALIPQKAAANRCFPLLYSSESRFQNWTRRSPRDRARLQAAPALLGGAMGEGWGGERDVYGHEAGRHGRRRERLGHERERRQPDWSPAPRSRWRLLHGLSAGYLDVRRRHRLPH